MSIIIENAKTSMILNRRRVLGDPERQIFFTDGKVYFSDSAPLEANGTGAVGVPIVLNPGSTVAFRAFKLYVVITTGTTRPLIWSVIPDQVVTPPELTFESDPQTPNRLGLISMFFDHATAQITFELEEADVGTVFKYKAIYGDGNWRQSDNFIG